MYRTYFKRIIDFITSLFLLILIFPLLLITGLLLFFQNKGTPFFFQDRPGYKEKKIRIIKFKSMTDEKDKNGDLLPDKERITTFGAFIRKTSIDELPQLINVVKGDMSLIGPRPLLFNYLDLYSDVQKRRHEVKPGITGWAQVNGRNTIAWSKKLEYDVHYVDNISFFFDMKILWLTILKVLKREGVNQSEERPMQTFTGDN